MASDLYWFVLSPLSAVGTVYVAALTDGVLRWILLGIAVLEAMPLVLLVAGFVVLTVLTDDVD
jgi:hypothetical protein